MLLKRKITVLLVCLSVNIIFGSQLSAADNAYKARVVGIEFADPPFPGDFMRSVAGQKEPGGKVTVFVSSNEKKIIAYDKQATQDTIKTYQLDKKGTKSAVPVDKVKAGYFAKIAKDNKSVILDFQYAFLPSKASTMLVQTNLDAHLTVASSQVGVEQSGVRIKPGSVLKLGPVTLTIAKIGKPSWGKEPLEITFDTDEKLEQLAEIQFYNQKGNEIKSSRTSTMTMSMGSYKKIQVSYKLAEKLDQVKVKAKYWKGLEMIKVPVSITLQPMF